ncbi:hypothetical protein [Empedobacter brevis]|uniref:hypothetical protein n=1 Tax=Empedobacter brevis TaxID=247 RepID=UPI0028A86291|nr:hypothetical protein [Empedobacter brevis]
MLWDNTYYLNVEGTWTQIPDNITTFEYKEKFYSLPRPIGGSGTIDFVGMGGSFKVFSAFKHALTFSKGGLELYINILIF